MIEGETGSAEIESVRYLKSGDKIFRFCNENRMELIRRQRSVMNTSPKNVEQECAIDALLSPQLNIMALTGRAGTGKTHGEDKEINYRGADYLIESGVIHIEPLTYIRGRSLRRRFLIIDEAQNLRPLDVKTIITRCGEGTTVVSTGDLEQIDSPFLDAASNGLAHLINKFIQEKKFCYLNLKQGARSAFAERAAELL